MLVLYGLYASGFALLMVKLLKTCDLWTSDLLLNLLLLWNNSPDSGSYTR
jgi:hypothetical protein